MPKQTHGASEGRRCRSSASLRATRGLLLLVALAACEEEPPTPVLHRDAVVPTATAVVPRPAPPAKADCTPSGVTAGPGITMGKVVEVLEAHGFRLRSTQMGEGTFGVAYQGPSWRVRVMAERRPEETEVGPLPAHTRRVGSHLVSVEASGAGVPPEQVTTALLDALEKRAGDPRLHYACLRLAPDHWLVPHFEETVAGSELSPSYVRRVVRALEREGIADLEVDDWDMTVARTLATNVEPTTVLRSTTRRLEMELSRRMGESVGNSHFPVDAAAAVDGASRAYVSVVVRGADGEPDRKAARAFLTAMLRRPAPDAIED